MIVNLLSLESQDFYGIIYTFLDIFADAKVSVEVYLTHMSCNYTTFVYIMSNMEVLFSHKATAERFKQGFTFQRVSAPTSFLKIDHVDTVKFLKPIFIYLLILLFCPILP